MKNRVSKITVAGLLGRLNHEIDFDAIFGPIILHGVNGVGKTKLIELSFGALSGDFERVARIPFKKIEVNFENGQNLSVEKPTIRSTELKWTLSENDEIADLRIPGVKDYSKIIRILIDQGYIYEGAPGQLYAYGNMGQISAKDAVDSYWNQVMTINPSLKKPDDDGIRAIRELVDVKLLGVDRLATFDGPAFPMRNRRPLASKLEELSSKLAELIRNVQAEHSSTSSAIDKEYPYKIFLEKDNVPHYTKHQKDEFVERYRDLVEQEKKLSSLGLIGDQPGHEVNFDDMQNWKFKALDLFVENSNRKLKTFDGIRDRLQLFLEIVNAKLNFKEITVGPRVGIEVEFDGQKILPSDLSSGEQHQIVMAYWLLFEVEPGSLVFIDEPELSLHIQWQREFIKDLMKISEINSSSYVIATHSPSIIWDHEENMVELRLGDGGVASVDESEGDL